MSFSAIQTVRGYSAAECASALQKCIRRCDDDQALYWAVELDRTGFGQYVWRRLLIMVSEDIGLAEPDLPATIFALHSTWKEMVAWKNSNHPERLMLVHAVLLMARANKSRTLDHATHVHYTVNDRLYEMPDEALDFHTAVGKRKGRGLDHWYAEAAHLNNFVDVGDKWEDASRDLAYAQDGGSVPKPLERTAGRRAKTETPDPEPLQPVDRESLPF